MVASSVLSDDPAPVRHCLCLARSAALAAKTPPLHCASTALVVKTLPLPLRVPLYFCCLGGQDSAFVAKTVPLPCASAALAAKPVPFIAVPPHGASSRYPQEASRPFVYMEKVPILARCNRQPAPRPHNPAPDRPCPLAGTRMQPAHCLVSTPRTETEPAFGGSQGPAAGAEEASALAAGLHHRTQPGAALTPLPPPHCCRTHALPPTLFAPAHRLVLCGCTTVSSAFRSYSCNPCESPCCSCKLTRVRSRSGAPRSSR